MSWPFLTVDLYSSGLTLTTNTHLCGGITRGSSICVSAHVQVVTPSNDILDSASSGQREAARKALAADGADVITGVTSQEAVHVHKRICIVDFEGVSSLPREARWRGSVETGPQKADQTAWW